MAFASNHTVSGIFPADAGVNLASPISVATLSNIPRGCGGEPQAIDLKTIHYAYSPRMRG